MTGFEPRPETVSAALDAWHEACHREMSNIDGMRHVLAAVLPDIREHIAQEVEALDSSWSPYELYVDGYTDAREEAAAVARGERTS